MVEPRGFTIPKRPWFFIVVGPWFFLGRDGMSRPSVVSPNWSVCLSSDVCAPCAEGWTFR